MTCLSKLRLFLKITPSSFALDICSIPQSAEGARKCFKLGRWKTISWVLEILIIILLMVVIVRECWVVHRTSAVSHSSPNVGVSGEQYPRRRARSITELMRRRSDASVVKRRHAMATYVRQTSDTARAVYRRAAEPQCSVRGSATLAARNLSVRSTSRVAERAEWQRSRLQWPRPASSRCGSARFLAVLPVQDQS